jgi:hypothetical protein
MKSQKHGSTIANTTRPVAEPFDAASAKLGQVDRMDPRPNVAAEHQVVHEKESSLPVTLVPGLGERKAPRRAASGDDEVMSTPPSVYKASAP